MTKARDLANIITGGFTADDIPNLAASKITSGTFADARIASSNVSQHATSFDDNKIVNDISTIALRQASNENKTAYNTQSMFVDVFQDGSGVASNTNMPRNDGEFHSSVVETTVSADAGGSVVDATSSNTYFSSSASRDEYGDGNDFSNNGSSGYSWYSRTALLTGDFRYKFSGTTRSATTNQNLVASGNYLEFGITSQQGASGTDQTGGVQANDCLSSDTGNPTGSATVPFIYLSTGGYGQVIQIRNKANTTRTALATISESWADNAELAFVRSGSTLSFQINGVTKYTAPSSAFNYSGNLFFNMGIGVGTANFTDVQYRSGMSAVKGTSTSSTNATGNFISNAITAPSSTSKMGAIITYQDNAGTNTLNTDIVLQLSADNGSNFTTATMTAMPDFATGIKMAKVNDLSVTAGTQLKYKISLANQSLGSKEARIRGVSLQY